MKVVHVLLHVMSWLQHALLIQQKIPIRLSWDLMKVTFIEAKFTGLFHLFDSQKRGDFHLFCFRAAENQPVVTPIKAHDGPISAIHCHPNQVNRKLPNQITNLCLSSSYDWSCKLWDIKVCDSLLLWHLIFFRQTNTSICNFEAPQDYVYDVQWSTVHPAVFACSDGEGKIYIYNLMKDFESPVADIKVSDTAVSKIRWSKDGQQLLAGDSNGTVKIFDCSHTVGVFLLKWILCGLFL